MTYERYGDFGELAGDLPDARLKGRRKQSELPGPFGRLYAKVFCVNCGADGGAVTKEWTQHIFYLCDPCAQKWGKIPLPEIPEELVR